MATTPPQKVNAGGRTVTSMVVINADDPNVEREDLNRKLKKLQDQIDALSAQVVEVKSLAQTIINAAAIIAA